MIKGALSVLAAMGLGWLVSLWRRWAGYVCPGCGQACVTCSIRMPSWDRYDLTARHASFMADDHEDEEAWQALQRQPVKRWVMP